MRFKNWKRPEFDERNETKWGWMCQHHQNLKLGYGVDVGAYCYLNARIGISLEDNVELGSHASIYSSTSIDHKEGYVTVKKNAKIGSHCTVMPGITIGENTIIGAHSFVNKDIPANVVAWGIPCKVQHKRK